MCWRVRISSVRIYLSFRKGSLHPSKGLNLLPLVTADIDVLGCGRVLTHGKRAPGAASKEQVCAAMQAAGLSNLGFFGCEVQTFQEHKREMQTMEERMGFHPPKQPPTVPSKPPCDDDKPPKGPPVHPPPPPSTEPPHSDDSPKPTCSTQELCKVIQSGLINIDVLGCSKVGVHLKRNVEEDEGGMGEVKIAECKRGTDGLCKHWPSGPHRTCFLDVIPFSFFLPFLRRATKKTRSSFSGVWR
ncbi:hypothetical protein V8E36_005357 [Tilletia maclaganii]